jgi:hypothetical protein
MRKAFHIFITLTLLMAVAIGHVGVFRCLIDGSFSITKTSCPQSISEEAPTCCPSNNSQELTFGESDNCCVDVDVETDFVNAFLSTSEDADIVIERDLAKAFYTQFNPTLTNKYIIIRGPPPSTESHLRVSTALIFKRNCTFLC